MRFEDIFQTYDPPHAILGAGRFEVALPSVFGFCGGVVGAMRAIRGALEAANGRPVLLLGEVIHNPEVNEALRSAGATIVPAAAVAALCAAPPHPAATAVIPAFGLPLNADAMARRAFPTIVDTTCPRVRSVWSFVSEAAADGFDILLHGHPGHPEVEATVSRARAAGAAVAVLEGHESAVRMARAIAAGKADSGAAWLGAPRSSAPLRLAMANQTTMMADETEAAARLVAEAAAAAGALFRRADTLCSATRDRQVAALALCATRPDAILVAGGHDSSNTRNLWRLASAWAPAYHVSGPEGVTPQGVLHYDHAAGRVRLAPDALGPAVRRVGVLAGASCPRTVVGAIVDALARLPPHEP